MDCGMMVAVLEDDFVGGELSDVHCRCKTSQTPCCLEGLKVKLFWVCTSEVWEYFWLRLSRTRVRCSWLNRIAISSLTLVGLWKNSWNVFVVRVSCSEYPVSNDPNFQNLQENPKSHLYSSRYGSIADTCILKDFSTNHDESQWSDSTPFAVKCAFWDLRVTSRQI